MIHYGEAFIDSSFLAGGEEWGWQCFACPWETTGLEDIEAAESAGADHVSEAS